MPHFHIRTTAHPEDATFILEAFDSALPHLASTGSGEQWGSQPRSNQPVFVKRVQDEVDKARSGISDCDAVFVAEVVGDDVVAGCTESRCDEAGKQKKMFVKVAAAVVCGVFPGYVSEQGHLDPFVRGAVGRADFLYLSVMVSDFRTGGLRKGAGAVLAQCVKGFYEAQGFVVVDGFEARKGEGVWPGVLLRMDVE
ncbi:hypothetical protein FKW77_005517 [Venturia effusa]|uniref:N-acetyltransferase domain-containing protein n=1 Tax=Venturia effusa TaxID=50376 RepID=A0A517LFH4_9PEZI|nr:hypothetical protein FKW77_005517 [Venturia effusa]